ncbi:TadE/TadG family type IV pilus assembly protein [Ferrimonas kyonanensis]|uniref:TadE/TadG family type IV pilus assembly protein n=1 Tax=Ferrimonas kyonanensis TaxID=364763 RepID=UPI00041F6C84|nr:TadE/TadG family type IV pilus assembly protein [Ferrimonas kyonanensis]
MKTNARSLNKQQGLAAIEAMITLPILFLFFFAIGELGRVMYQYNQLNSIARNACRYLINNAKPGTTSLIDLTDAVQSQAKDLAVYGTTGGSTSLLSGFSVNDISISVPAGTDVITVTATYNWTPIFNGNLAGDYGTTVDYSFPLTATISMRAL